MAICAHKTIEILIIKTGDLRSQNINAINNAAIRARVIITNNRK
jgi:hypothetical protein